MCVEETAVGFTVFENVGVCSACFVAAEFLARDRRKSLNFLVVRRIHI